MSLVFFFNDTATTEIYTLSLHDALPISAADLRVPRARRRAGPGDRGAGLQPRAAVAATAGCDHRQLAALARRGHRFRESGDRKSTRLNSSHANISYAVFCLKKKKIDKVT